MTALPLLSQVKTINLNDYNLEQLLDTSQPFDEDKVRLLEVVVNTFLVGAAAQRSIAHEVLSRLKLNSDSWRIVGTVLQISKDSNTRFFGLSILEECICKRWQVLPEEQRSGIKQYVTNMTLTCCSDPTLADAKHFITKINETLIQIVKYEWPHNWETFIPDLCAAARTSQPLCENSMRILSLFSEEIFDFGSDQMTQKRVSQLMHSLNAQFQQIYDLCMFVLQSYVSSNSSVSPSLLAATLQCLAHYLKWVPYEYIFDTGLIDILLEYFWDPTNHRADCVRCLAEIASLKNVSPEGLIKLRDSFWTRLVNKISCLSETSWDYENRCPPNSRLFWETFYCQLSICLTTFLKNHLVDVCETKEGPEGTALVVFGLEFLVKMTSQINHDETFKICVDYWHHLSSSLLSEARGACKSNSSDNTNTSPLLLDAPVSSTSPSLSSCGEPCENLSLSSKRLQTYQPVLTLVRRALVLKMAKPQEVCIHYDEESGTVEREYQTDTDEVALYNVLRETLVYLTNLGGAETQEVMLTLLWTFTEDVQNPNPKNWNPNVLSRLCWAIGSVSGAMTEARERDFLVVTVKSLLSLCELKRGKENKAIVASMIMYVFGQYPRFLKSYIKFLETVIQKLFEFMQETFPGVQDMACETFLKISRKCKQSLATSYPDPCNKFKVCPPLIDSILPQVPMLYTILPTPKQQLMLFEGVGHIISAATGDPNRQRSCISSLLSSFNSSWSQILSQLSLADSQSEEIYELGVSRKLSEILRMNERVAYSTGTAFSKQLLSVYPDMLKIYSLYSSRISLEVSRHGVVIMGHTHIKSLRAVKRASLLLVEAFVDQAVDRTSRSGGSERSGSSSDQNNNTGTYFNNGVEGSGINNVNNINPNDNESSQLIRQQIVQFIIPPLLQHVLEDYRSSVPQVRDHEVLSLLTTLITKLDTHIIGELPRIFDYIFDCTLDMIKGDFHSFPDHRAKFYGLLKACNDYCFCGLFTLPEHHRRLFVESLVWAFKHEQPSVAEQGLVVMQNFLKNLSLTKTEVLAPFCVSFYWSILEQVFEVLTDTLHKSGFQLQAFILMYLIQLVEMGRINIPESQITKPDVMLRLGNLILSNFTNLNRTQVEAFIVDLFNHCSTPSLFSRHLRDFLVELKAFSGADELFEEDRLEAVKRAKEIETQRMQQIPGMAPQYTPAEFTNLDDLE